MNKLFLDYIKKFHQLSNPIREYYVSADIDQVLLQKNIENYSKISLEEYEVLKTDKFIIELDKIINNITNEKCLYFVIYSFYNDKYLKNGNYAYDFTGKKLVKYMEIKNKNREYSFSISFFVSLNNCIAKYGSSGYIQSILKIGGIIKEVENLCKHMSKYCLKKIKDFNKIAFELDIDKTQQLAIAQIDIKE